MRTNIASALVIAASAFCSSVAYAATIPLTSQLTAAQEVPPVTSQGKGQLKATLDTTTSQLRWEVVYSGLSGPVTAGHFHGPASKTENAGVALGFKGDLNSPIGARRH